MERPSVIRGVGSGGFGMGERVRVLKTAGTVQAGTAGVVGVIAGTGRCWSRRVSEYVVRVETEDGFTAFGVRPDEIERVAS
jgi:hypothetical protein